MAYPGLAVETPNKRRRSADAHALPPEQPHAARRRWMAVLARADVAQPPCERLGELPAYRVLRGPEAGLVMVSGRTGGGGAPFNLGEMTATRCTVRTDLPDASATPTLRGAMSGWRSWRR